MKNFQVSILVKVESRLIHRFRGIIVMMILLDKVRGHWQEISSKPQTLKDGKFCKPMKMWTVKTVAFHAFVIVLRKNDF